MKTQTSQDFRVCSKLKIHHNHLLDSSFISEHRQMPRTPAMPRSLDRTPCMLWGSTKRNSNPAPQPLTRTASEVHVTSLALAFSFLKELTHNKGSGSMVLLTLGDTKHRSSHAVSVQPEAGSPSILHLCLMSTLAQLSLVLCFYLLNPLLETHLFQWMLLKENKEK